MACTHAIKLSYLPEHHGHMWDLCWEKPLSQANSSLVTMDLFIFLVVRSGQNCAKTLLTVEQYRWLSSSAQSITWQSLIYKYRYFHRIHLFSWLVEVQHKVLTGCWLPTPHVPESSSMVHARRVSYSSTVLISQMFSLLCLSANSLQCLKIFFFIWVALNIWCICLDLFNLDCVWHQRIFSSLHF